MSAVGDSNLTGTAARAAGKPPLAVPRRILRMRSDAALAERFVAGDEAAFDVIYERHRPTVLAVCMGILGRSHDAEDATQETFSSLAVALRSHPPQELRPWLTRVARNASIDTTRRRRHRLLTIDGEIPEVPARQSNAASELNSVLDGIRELPESQRTALLMRELGGHSYSEIAGFLDVDEDAVRGLIARARVGLRTYREAAEFPCASARAAIEAEPDGRRHDKTVRRHLRSCGSCRSYRAALRGDAKALRAVFPWQAGGIAGSGLATGGAITAAKSAMVGASLTQLAATCAASVCAVGAVGGVVLLNPVHRIFNPVQLSIPVTHHHPTATRSHATRAAGTAAHSTVQVPPVAPAAPPRHASVIRASSTAGDGYHRPAHTHRSKAPFSATAPGHQHHWGWQTGGSSYTGGQSGNGGHNQGYGSSGGGSGYSAPSGGQGSGNGHGHQGSWGSGQGDGGGAGFSGQGSGHDGQGSGHDGQGSSYGQSGYGQGSSYGHTARYSGSGSGWGHGQSSGSRAQRGWGSFSARGGHGRWSATGHGWAG